MALFYCKQSMKHVESLEAISSLATAGLYTKKSIWVPWAETSHQCSSAKKFHTYFYKISCECFIKCVNKLWQWNLN